MNERSIWMLVAFALVLIILYLHQCRRATMRTETKEVVKRDTIYRSVHDTTVWKVPVVRSVIEYDTITRWFPVREFIDTAYLLHDYMLTRYYQDTTRIQQGFIVTRDSVRENRIVAHQVETSLQIPVITETITKYEPKRTEIYAGLGMLSGRQDLIHAFEGSLSLKNKADQIYSLGAVMGTNGQLYWKGSVMIKLSFKKNR